MKVHFYYVRHGETLFNEIRRMQGACDSPLTQKGIEQAKDTASALRHVHFDHIFCSSSERAWDTAKMIAAYHGIEPVYMKELREFDFGNLDGEMIDRFYERIQPHRMADDWTDVGGENVALFKTRAQKGFDKILAECRDGDTVLIVSHGSYLMHLMKTHFNFDQQEYIRRRQAADLPFVPNCSVSEFEYEDGVYTLTAEPQTADEFRRRTPKKVTFYYVRHGQTVFNKNKRMQGWSDAPLTGKGIQDALRAKERLKDVSFAKAYCSTAERARDTAEIILQGHGIRAVPRKELREIYFGKWEGAHYEKHWAELNDKFLMDDWKEDGGESHEDVQNRIHAFFRDAADAASDGDEILVTAHGTLYAAVLEALLGISRKEFYESAAREGRDPIPNAGIAKITYRDGTYELTQAMA